MRCRWETESAPRVRDRIKGDTKKLRKIKVSQGLQPSMPVESREQMRSVENAMGTFSYGRLLAEAEQSAEERLYEGKSKTITRDFGLLTPVALEIVCKTALNDETGEVTFFLTMDQGVETTKLPIPASVIETCTKQLESLKTTPEARKRKRQQLLRKRARTPHLFAEHEEFKGKCKSCRKGRNTKAHKHY